MQLKEIENGEEILQTLSILQQIYENLDHKNYLENILSMMERGYKMAGVFENKNHCIGVIGIYINERIQYGRVAEICDFMIDRKKRGVGVGKMLLRWVDWQAMNFHCQQIIGCLETKRQESQKIFSREKFLLDGFLFRKKL